MTELTLFRLNQVPDRVYESFLDLVGISPYPSSQATGDLTFMFASVPDENRIDTYGHGSSVFGR